MIGVEYVKSPRVTILKCQLGSGDTLACGSLGSEPYIAFVDLGEIEANGRTIEAPGFILDVDPHGSFEMTGLAKESHVTLTFRTESFDVALDLPELAARKYAGNWLETDRKDWPKKTLNLEDVRAMAIEAIQADQDFRDRFGVPL